MSKIFTITLNEPFCTYAEAAEYLHVSEREVREAVAALVGVLKNMEPREADEAFGELLKNVGLK